MPRNLKRYSGAGDLHFITCSCYHRRQYLASARRRDLFLTILEQVRQRYGFVVLGYVVMPEHFHLLISEPDKGNPSIVMQVLKQRFARRVIRRSHVTSQTAQCRLWNLPPMEDDHFWQRRFYDFNIWTERKETEKLSYMHHNPVKRELVSKPDQWAWSSFRSYVYGEAGQLRINYQSPTK